MAKLTGVFESTDIIDVNFADLNQTLTHQREDHELENFLANRILYPQTISVTKDDFDVDCGILKQIIKNTPDMYSNTNLVNKIIIPSEIMVRFPPISRLVSIFIDALNLTGIIQIFTRQNGRNELIGSAIKLKKDPQKSIDLNLDKKNYSFSKGSITILPLTDRHLTLKIDDSDEVIISGGKLGVVIDVR